MDPRDIQGDELLAELMRSQSLDGDCAGGALPSLQQQQRPPFSAHVPDRCDSRREGSLAEPTRREPLDQADEDGTDSQKGSCPTYEALLAEKARRQAVAEGMACPDPSLDRRLAASYLQVACLFYNHCFCYLLKACQWRTPGVGGLDRIRGWHWKGPGEARF